jgi:threonine/homoserine/homoserine lactone efflux protein
MDYLAIMLFAVATCVTPGPNNVMLMSSGVNFGIGRTMRHVIGINIGFPFMLIAVGSGAGALFHGHPKLYTVLQVAGAMYMLYLAYQIATTPDVNFNDTSGKPLGIFNAALFQWINPKAWVMSIGAILAYTTPSSAFARQVLLIALIFFVCGCPCSLLWVLFGRYLRKFLTQPNALRIFNVAMSLLLVGSLLPTVFELTQHSTLHALLSS